MLMLSDPKAAQYALLAGVAEDIFQDGVWQPALPVSYTQAWTIIAHLTAENALFGGEAVGKGTRCYYGFVAFNVLDPSEHIAVVRGTVQGIEWFENIKGALVNGPPVGRVEHGFYDIYKSMRYLAPGAVGDGLLAAQGLTIGLPEGASLTVIGHSLGSALATYLMTDIARIPGNPFSVRGALFASPRPGDAEYVRSVDDLVGPGNYRVYNYMRDIVPHVPPSLPFGLGFQGLPQTTWITPATAQANIHNDPFCNHHASSYAAMLDASSIRTTCTTRKS